MISLAPYVHGFVDWLLRAGWQASVLAVLVLLAQGVFRGRLPARWRHALWGLVVARLVLPALPASSFSIFRLVPDMPVSGVRPPVIASGETVVVTVGNKPISAKPDPAPPSPLDWRILFATCWAVGAGLLALRLVLSNLRFARRIAKAQTVAEPALHTLLDECQLRMGIARRVVLLQTDAVGSPAVVGVWRPRLLLPPRLLAVLSEQELRFVFLHELAHVRRLDLAGNWVLAIVSILHWFNPMVWLAANRCRADRELACDEAVLRSIPMAPQQEYGMTIIKLVEHLVRGASAPGTVGIIESRTQLHRRIARIAAFDTRTTQLSLLGVALLLILGTVAMTEANASPPANPAAPSSQAARSTGDVPLPAGDFDDSDLQIEVESRLLTLAETDFQKIKDQLEDQEYPVRLFDENANPVAGSDYSKGHFIDAEQRDGILRTLGEPGLSADTSVLMAPRIRLRNGQEAKAEVQTLLSYVKDFKRVTNPAGKVDFEPQIATLPTGTWLKVRATASLGKRWHPALGTVGSDPPAVPSGRDRSSVILDIECRNTRLIDLKTVPYKDAPAGRHLLVQLPVSIVYEVLTKAWVPLGKTLALVSKDPPAGSRQGDPKLRMVLLVTPYIVAADQ